MQRIMAGLCIFAGVLILWGVGWALLVAGVMTWMQDERSAAWLVDRWRRLRDWASRMALAARTAPRKSLAASAMGAGLAVTPVGVAAAFGVGVAVIVGGGLLIGFALLTGWGA